MFWYEDDIKRLEQQGLALASQPVTLFYGSSSIRLWNSLQQDFDGYNPVNLGFGGSTLAACAWFFDRVMANFKAERLVIYAGDNDLGDGRHPEEVFLFFQQLAARVQERFGPIPCYFISLKPSMARWHMVSQFHFTNLIISAEVEKMPNWHWVDVYNPMLNEHGGPDTSYYDHDGLHLSPRGYELWAGIVKKALNS